MSVHSHQLLLSSQVTVMVVRLCVYFVGVCDGYVTRACVRTHSVHSCTFFFAAFAGARRATWAVKNGVLLLGGSDWAVPVLAG